MFIHWTDVVFALFAGMLFGALLQRAHVARFHVIVNQLLFKDWTPLKLMVSAAAVGAVGLYMMAGPDVGLLRPKIVGRIDLAIGAVLFGVGLAIFGYCPGTSLVASMEGRRDALAGVIGMFFGAGLFAFFGRSLSAALPSLGNFGQRTWTEVTPIDNPAIYIAVLFLLAGAVALIDWRTPHVHDGDLDSREPIHVA